MNHRLPGGFETFLEKAISPIAARAGRKRMMREEMLAHLHESYEQELNRRGDATAAAEAAMHRLGDAQTLHLQLQASVPLFERLLFQFLNRKENAMLRWLWIVGLLAWIVGAFFTFPQNVQVELCGIALFCGAIFWHLGHQNNIASRFFGSRWYWVMGIVAVLFGMAVVSPAVAKIENDGGAALLSLESLTLGALIVIGGIVFVAQGSMRQPPRAA